MRAQTMKPALILTVALLGGLVLLIGGCQNKGSIHPFEPTPLPNAFLHSFSVFPTTLGLGGKEAEMTAYVVEDLVQQALEEGAYGIVYKPLDIERMVTVIEEAKEAKEGALVLVVDDDPGTCITLRNILTRKSYEVGIAYTGEEAIAMAREKAQDIIFIDMKLPTINGLETYLAIREINPEVVAIMMTGYRQEMAELVEVALQNHAYTCLYKPLEMEDLLRLVEEIVKRKA